MRTRVLVGSVALVTACSTGKGGDSSWNPTHAIPMASPIATRAAPCGPTGGGPYWILEGETVTFDAACATGTAGSFRIDPLPAGATFDGTHFQWTPGLDQAAVYHLHLADSLSGDVAEVKVGVADDFTNPHNVLVKDPTQYEEEYGVPVIFVSPGPNSFTTEIPVTLVYGGHTYAATGKKRGVTSTAYPKNSYVFTFPKDDKFSDPAHFDHKKRRIAVTNTFDDNSLLRNRMAYAMWAQMDPGHIRLQAYDAVVYLNGKFWGVYTVSDRIDHNLLKNEGVAETGNLFEAREHQADWRLVEGTSGAAKVVVHEGFEKKDGTPKDGQPGAWTDLDDDITWVATATNADFNANAGTRFDLRDYEDWWIFVTFMLAEDNAAKNSFHYHDVAAGGPFRYIPWDFNATFGQDWQTRRRDATAYNDFSYANHLFERMLGSGTIRSAMRARYRATLDGPWKKTDLDALFDGYAAEIAPVAHRDEAKWGATYRSYPAWADRTDFNSWDDEVRYLRNWIDRRWDYASKNYAAH